MEGQAVEREEFGGVRVGVGGRVREFFLFFFIFILVLWLILGLMGFGVLRGDVDDW